MGRFLPYEQPDSDGGRSRAAERNPGRKRFWPALDFSRWKTLPSWSAVGAMCAVYRRRKGFSRTGPGNAKEQRGMRRFRLRGFGKSKHRVHAGRYLLQPDPAPGHPPARAEKRNSKPANRSRSHALSLARLSFPTPARGTCGPECKGCPGTFCKGCHGTGHLKGRSSTIVLDIRTLIWMPAQIPARQPSRVRKQSTHTSLRLGRIENELRLSVLLQHRIIMIHCHGAIRIPVCRGPNPKKGVVQSI